MIIKTRKTLSHKQNGNVLIVFIVALFALIAVVSLALDGGHLLLNKGKLQNVVDAAALHAASELDEGATHEEARTAVVAMIQLNIAHRDHRELADAINTVDQIADQLIVEFSQEPDPFIQDNDETAKYVKVSLSQLNLDNFFANIFNFNKQVSATALAGPSADIDTCYEDIVPMVVCGDPTLSESNYGLGHNSLNLMKIGSNNDNTLGPGNFQLLRLEGNTGAADIRSAMAGESDAGIFCLNNSGGTQTVDTEPGNTVGPVAQGLNTRMGKWQGPVNSTDHLRDNNICQGETIALNAAGDGLEASAASKSYLFDEYITDSAASSLGTMHDYSCDSDNTIAGSNNISHIVDESDTARSGRRMLQVIVADCNGEANGANTLDFLDIGCFFLTQEVGHSGPESYVIGEFIDFASAEGLCANSGSPSLHPLNGTGPYKIVLYHVIDSSDS